MNHKTNHTTAQNAPYLLLSDQLNDPRQVVQEFFENRHLADHRQALWEILTAAITGNSSDLYTVKEVGEWVLYFRELEEMLEAAWVLNQSNK